MGKQLFFAFAIGIAVGLIYFFYGIIGKKKIDVPHALVSAFLALTAVGFWTGICVMFASMQMFWNDKWPVEITQVYAGYILFGGLCLSLTTIVKIVGDYIKLGKEQLGEKNEDEPLIGHSSTSKQTNLQN